MTEFPTSPTSADVVSHERNVEVETREPQVANTLLRHRGDGQTLPERNAPNRVLEKAGFVFEQPDQDNDVTVWRYSLARTQTIQARDSLHRIRAQLATSG